MKLKYPYYWAGEASEGLIVNHSELTGFCTSNGLSAGEIAYVADQMRMTAVRTINNICESRED